jgi:signal transduction histidine kinase
MGAGATGLLRPRGYAQLLPHADERAARVHYGARMWLRRFGVRPGDLAPAAALAFVQIVGSSFAAHGQPDRRGLDLAGYLLLALGPLALAFWRRHTVAVLAAVVTVTLVYLLAEYPFGPFLLSVIVALVAGVVRGHRLAAWLSAATLYAGHFLGTALLDLSPGVTPAGLVGVAAWFLVVLTGAEVARGARERRLEKVRLREEETRRRADEERLRIARELHDVLGHNISLINVQAGVALHLMDERPEQARTALSAIKEASGEALREVRATLDVLRGNDEALPRAPAPGLRRLNDLVASAGGAGLLVSVEIAGRERPLPLGVDQAAFRIVQEALTNVRRHAGAGSATVRLVYGDRELAVSVVDDGRGPVDGDLAASGSGIDGMRARASALGGRLEAGAREGGGFRVLARLPLDGPE